MNTEKDDLRFSAKLLFQFRIEVGGDNGKRRLCEERIVTFHAKSGRAALAAAKCKGKQSEHIYENDAGNRVYFEFVGILELLELGALFAADEVWYDIKERLLPMERRDKLIPPEDQLCALLNEQARRNRR